jgi:hypothetical protein
MERKAIAAAIAAGFFIVTMTITGTSVGASPAAAKQGAVSGEKVDSGLGKVPHFSEWERHPELRWIARTATRGSNTLAAPAAPQVVPGDTPRSAGNPALERSGGRIEPASAPLPR